jgi:hypothetical protein
MKKNLGILDRFVRFFLGIAALCIGIAVANYVILAIILAVFGLLMLYEGFAGFCLLYHWIGISTKKR